MQAPITSKRQMYELLRAGALGNTLRTWRSIDEINRDGYEGEVALRMTTGSCGHFISGVDIRDGLRLEITLLEAGCCIDDIVFCEPFPDQLLTLQGELSEQAPYGLVLAWDDTRGLNMRQSNAQGFKLALGLAARELLRARLSAASYDDLMELLEVYPAHVIEFSAAEVFVGDRPGRNAVVWEMRRY